MIGYSYDFSGHRLGSQLWAGDMNNNLEIQLDDRRTLLGHVGSGGNYADIRFDLTFNGEVQLDDARAVLPDAGRGTSVIF